MNSYIKNALLFLQDIIFTVKCPYCQKVIERNDYACKKCKSKFPLKGFETYAIGGYKTISPFKYDGIFASGVKNFKFHENPSYARQLAVPLVDEILAKYDINSFDIITAIPMYYKNQRERGYNQSELLAKQCSEIMGIPYAELLEKHKANKAQHTLKGKERENNVHGVYRVADIELAADKTILIIDDIITTGNTLGECCKVLKKAGCKSISCATLCAAIV